MKNAKYYKIISLRNKIIAMPTRV